MAVLSATRLKALHLRAETTPSYRLPLSRSSRQRSLLNHKALLFHQSLPYPSASKTRFRVSVTPITGMARKMRPIVLCSMDRLEGQVIGLLRNSTCVRFLRTVSSLSTTVDHSGSLNSIAGLTSESLCAADSWDQAVESSCFDFQFSSNWRVSRCHGWKPSRKYSL